jgi:hypothetical protein
MFETTGIKTTGLEAEILTRTRKRKKKSRCMSSKCDYVDDVRRPHICPLCGSVVRYES